jgi:uncharacterized protein YbjT (DUF2867 family)
VRVVVFGAGGGTGRAAVALARAQGHEVTAFVRRAPPLEFDATIRVLRGDATRPLEVAEAVCGQDAVLSFLGSKPWQASGVCSAGARNIVNAMQREGVRRLVVLSSLGVGDSRALLGWFARSVMIPLVLEREMHDKGQMEECVRASQLDWVIVRLATSVLSNGPLTGKRRTSVDELIQSRTLPRADVADFCLEQARDDRFLRRAVFLA